MIIKRELDKNINSIEQQVKLIEEQRKLNQQIADSGNRELVQNGELNLDLMIAALKLDIINMKLNNLL